MTSPGAAPASHPAPAGAVAGERPLVAALVAQRGGEVATYPLFDGISLRGGAIFLAGPLLLEVDEIATIEFRLPDGPVRARARVVEVVQDAAPGLVVTLIDVDEATAARITSAAAG